MRSFLSNSAAAVAILLFAAPLAGASAFAADGNGAASKTISQSPTAQGPLTTAKPAGPMVVAAAAAPTPPAVTYQVWGFKWSGAAWVRQPKYMLQTADLKQAADYKAQINGFAGWTATTNLPTACYVHTIYQGPTVSRTRPGQSPEKPTYSVWAFALAGGRWVKSDQYSWTTSDPVAGLKYAKQVNAVAGWTATTNCPPPIPTAPRIVQGGMVQGAANYSMHINLGGISVTIPYSMLQRGGVGGQGGGSYETSASSDNWPTYSDTSDTSDIQNSISLQDSINAQNALDDEQNLIDEQNFENTENMINSEQENLNAQPVPSP